MRNILTLSTAASVLAFGFGAQPAAALFPATGAADSQALVHKTQQRDEKGAGARGQEGGRTLGPGNREGGGGASSFGGGASQERGGDRGAAQDRGNRGAQMGQSERGAREGQRQAGGERGERAGGRRAGVNVNVHGRTGERDRFDRRTRVGVDVDRGRHYGGRDVDVNVRGHGYGSGRTYGYTAGGTSCQEILRRYPQCFGR